jgi:hypothetical protein
MKKFLDKDIDMLVDDVVILLYDSDSGEYDGTDEWISDIPGAGIIARSGTLAGKTTTLGVFDANNITVSAVPAGNVDTVIVCADLGADGASPVLCWLDLGVVFPTTGADVTVSFHASGIFAL